MEHIKNIASQFAIQGTISQISPLGNGLINDTYKITTAEPAEHDYVLQRINHHIFTDVPLLQHNIEVVTGHIRRQLEKAGTPDIDRRVLTFLPTKEGKTFYYDEEKDEYWRVSVFISNAVTIEKVDETSSYNAGNAFGNFESMLTDVADQLGETIPSFHNMELRRDQLRDVLRRDPVGRAASVAEFVNQIESYMDEMCQGERLLREGKLALRVCHCDTKVNNVMFDTEGNVLCVIDLDTVMPNFIFSDYGDFLRTGANYVAEDCPDMGKVGFNMDIFKAFTEGYLKGAGSFLLPVEIENLPYAAALFPYMQCVRFLWDYISGDKYWKCKYPDHNFDRANNQLHLFLSAESHYNEMKDFIAAQMA